MKCNKCGESISEEKNICPNCNERVVNNDKKTNKKLFVIFAFEIIIVLLIVLGISNYYSKNFENKIATQNEFKEILTQKGYTVEEETNSKGIKSYDFATNKKNIGFHYIVANNNIKADNTFNSIYNQLQSQQQGGYMKTSFNLINYNYYSLEDNDNYGVLIKNDKTIFSASGLSKYKNEINKMVEDLGFGYPVNSLYIIIFIGIIVSALIIATMWMIFVKAGIKGWYSLIPIYNLYCLSNITFNNGWLFIFMFITPINIVFILVTFYKLAKKFGKNTLFAICSIFFPYITMQIIAFGNSKYINKD